MSANKLESIDSGKIKLKVLTTNEVSLTLLTDERFNGKVIQPERSANRVMGEHGFAMSIEIKDDNEKHLYLIDTGGLPQSIIENCKQFNVNLKEVEKLILTHGHFDHFGGLTRIMPELKEGCEIILNPNCYLQFFTAIPKSNVEISPEEIATSLKQLEKEGKIRTSAKLPQLSKNIVQDLAQKQGLKIIEANEPIKLHEGLMTSGEIELFDENEITKGFYIMEGRKDYKKHYFRDETAVYINVQDKGLVVITGCGHSGIINIIKHGQKLSGIEKIYALIGGFHEEWNPLNIIEEKVKFLENLNLEIVCGMHCTGFEFNKIMSRHPSHTLGVTGTEFNL